MQKRGVPYLPKNKDFMKRLEENYDFEEDDE